jgi:hypothetical protein
MTQKTTELNIDGEVVDVSELPKEIRDSIDFFDKIGADITKLSDDIAQMQYQHNVWFIAATAIKNKIVADVSQIVEAQKAKDEAEEKKKISEKKKKS